MAEIEDAIEIRRCMTAREVSAHDALVDAGWSISRRVEDRAPGIFILNLAEINSILQARRESLKGHQNGVLQNLLERLQEPRARCAINDAMVAGEGHPATEPYGDLPVFRHRLFFN